MGIRHIVQIECNETEQSYLDFLRKNHHPAPSKHIRYFYLNDRPALKDIDALARVIPRNTDFLVVFEIEYLLPPEDRTLESDWNPRIASWSVLRSRHARV
jgi:hypothetical protein